MKILICIDDTDNLESIGTGEVLENLCSELEKSSLGRGGFVTRHQLFIHEDIAYTSHNSSMCCEAEIEDFEKALAFCRSYMDVSCAEGSDPGLCFIKADMLTDYDRLIAFGKSAKVKVLTKQDALNEAGRYPDVVYLSEHGGTGDGIIGALAGCGLRLYGYDGKIKGKLKPRNPQEILTVEKLCSEYGLSAAMDLEHNFVPLSDTVLFREPGKAVFWNRKIAVFLVADESGSAMWRMPGNQELKGLVD